METFILDYRIIIEPETDKKTGKKVYTAFCPRVGVSDWGKSVEEAISHIKEAIECHLKSLIKHQKAVPPPDLAEFMVTTASVSLPKGIKLAFS